MAGYFRGIASAFSGLMRAMVPTSGYDAARMGRRTLSVGTSTRGAASLALSDGASLLARARKAEMDNPLVTSGLIGFGAEVIGRGMRPHFRHPDPDKRRQLEREWNLWAPQASAVRRVGPDGKPDSMQGVYLLQLLACRSVVQAG